MLGVLWIVLKVLLIVLAVLLGLVLVLLLLPVTAELHYEAGQFTAKAGTLGLLFQVYPFQEKPEGEEKPRKPKKNRRKKTAVQKKQPAAAGEKPKTAEKKFRITLGAICELVSAAGTLMRQILAGLKIYAVRLRLPVQGADAADTAVQYGKTNAELHSALAVLRNFLDIHIEEMALVPDFTGEKQGTELFSCKITGRLIIIVISGLRALWQLYRGGVL